MDYFSDVLLFSWFIDRLQSIASGIDDEILVIPEDIKKSIISSLTKNGVLFI